MKLYLFIAVIVLISCNRPVADGAFVGNWYVLNFKDGFEHWEIDNKNNVFIFDKFKDTVRLYHLETKFYEKLLTDFPNFYVISENKKDSIVFDWIESSNYPPIIPKDTIRIYHSFVMVRGDELSIKNMNKSEIHDYFMNSTFIYEHLGTDFIIHLSDESIDQLKYKADMKAEGCLEFSTSDAFWSLDTLSNLIVFEHSLFGRYVQTLMVNDITLDTVTVDLDEFYWFRNNIKLTRISNHEKEFYYPEKLERNEIGKNGFECDYY